MEEKYVAPKAEDIELVEQEEEIVEKRYVAAPKWKRIVAFLIDFLIYASIIYLVNIYVTKPYFYPMFYDINAVTEQYDADVLAIELTYNTDEFTFVTEEGVLCEPAYEGYKCIESYGSYQAGDILLYNEFQKAAVLEENLDKWEVDRCYLTYWQILSSPEYKAVDKAYDKICTRYDQLTQLIDSFWILIIVYIIPPMFFNYGRTLGKRLMHLLVVDHMGRPIKRMMYLFRTLIGFWALEYVTSIFTLYLVILVSGIVTFINHKQRSIHDIVFGTCVVSDQMEERVVVFEKVEEPPEPEIIIDDEEYY